MGQLIAEQTAERATQHGAQMKRVEARLKSIEQLVGESGVGIEPLRSKQPARAWLRSQ